MSLAWPWALLVLATVPAILLTRWWAARRRKRVAVRVASLAMVRRALPTTRRWRRVIPPVLLVLGLVLLGVAAARPQHTVAISSNETTIVLALDVSGSMCSTDVDPNRLEAAQKAAGDYIKAQPGGSRMGLVTFAGFATVLVPPTDDTDVLLDAVQSLTTARGTAIGQGILTSLDAIAEIDAAVAPTGAVLSQPATSYAAAAIVLLTDGSNTAGVDPLQAAEQAAARGVRVYTIGFGTDTPAPGVCTGSQVRPGNGFPGGGFGGFGRGRRDIDEETLQRIANTTDGTYYRAVNAHELNDALGDLPQHIATAHQKVDIAAQFALVGGMLMATAFGLSLWWNRVRTSRRPSSGPGVEQHPGGPRF